MMDVGDLSGRCALVTGAGSGIGEATAKLFSVHGARVAVVDIDGAAAERTVAAIRKAGGDAEAYVTDVSDADAVENMASDVVQRYGTIDIGHVNAATMVSAGNLLETPLAVWDRTFAINCRGAYLTARACLRHMVEARHGGALCFTGSDTALRTPLTHPAYIATKHAIIGIARSVAVDFGSMGIRSNVVTPGVTETPGLHQVYSSGNRDSSEIVNDTARLSVLRRVGVPEDVAKAVVFLCSDQAGYITGSNLVVDGGMTVQYEAE